MQSLKPVQDPKATTIEVQERNQIVSADSFNTMNDKKSKILKRLRKKKVLQIRSNPRTKSKTQTAILKQHFAKDTRWTREKMLALCKETGLTFMQIYKWNWDQRFLKDVMYKRLRRKENLLANTYFVIENSKNGIKQIFRTTKVQRNP